MKRVRCSVAMSLDGYIAGPKKEIDWILADPEIDFNELYASFDTVLMGRKTYEAMRQQGSENLMTGKEVYVFSRTLRPADCPGVTVSHDPKAVVEGLRAGEGKDIWLFGGGSLFRSLLKVDLVDSVEVALIPVLVGGGIPLLPKPASLTNLKLVRHRVYKKTGTVLLEYAVL